jgi:tetratricopeptide (TPR) repeat protein
MRAVLPVSMLLIDYGMADAAPLLFRSALGPKPDVKELNWALRSVMQGLATAEARGDVELARGVFTNAKALVDLAARKQYLAEARPGAADFYYAMGAMESRVGNLTAAHAQLEAAVAFEPTPQSYRLIAAIERQRGDAGAALRSLSQMLTLVRKAGDPATEAATQLMIYDLLRESGKQPEADSALAAALQRVLAARQSARSSPELAAVERVLADVLERYGELAAAARAVERAGEAARNDVQQLAATVLDAARRALVLGDLNAGRKAMHWALEWDLEDDDLIYAALWTKLLHERLGVSSDGSVEEALQRADGQGIWPGSLRDWARGGITAEQLLARASNPVQHVEARFYVALTKYYGDRKSESLEPLQVVANSEAIELVEVRMARDLLAESRGLSRPTLPAGLKIP